jgi:hypothetical protein
MSSALSLLVVFVLFVAGVAFAARLAGRPLGRPETAVFLAATVLFLLPGFFRAKTILPVDHAMLLPPWSHAGAGPRHNANLNDAITQLAPWAKAVRMAWKEGSLPLRDRWNGSSMALAGNAQSAAFSPFTLLSLPFALWASFTVLAAAKIFLALSGTSLWLRELGVSRPAAGFGAALYAFGFAMVPWLLFPSASVLALLPWALFAIELLRDDARRGGAFVLLVAVLTAWPLCGHPETAAVGALFAGLWLVARVALGDLPLPDVRRLFSRAALAAALAIGLTAFLTVPVVLAIRASNRVRVAEAFRAALPASLAPHLPLWPAGFLTPLFPRTLGDAIDSPPIPGAPGNFPEMTLAFVGIVGATMALLVFRPGARRNRAAVALAVPIAAGLLAATGTWPLYDIAVRAPGLRLMFVLRWYTLAGIGIAALAAFEADRLARDLAKERERRTILAPLAAVPAAAAVSALAWLTWRHFLPFHTAQGAAGVASQRAALVLSLSAAGAVAAIAVAGLLLPRASVARTLPLLLGAAAVAELFAQGRRLYEFGDPRRLYPATPLVEFLRSRPGPFRTAGDGAVLFPNSNVFAGVEDIRTHDPMEREDYVDFLDRGAGYAPADYFKRIRSWSAPALDLLNVVYLAGDPGETFPAPKWRRVYDGADGVVYENADALPRVFAAARIAPQSRHVPDGFEVTDWRERTNGIVFRLHAPAAVPAVVSVVQDGGWTASDESGRPMATSKAAGILLALELPAGDHEIRLSYRPPGFAAGAALSATTAAALVAVAIVTVRRRLRRRPGSPETGSG